MNDNPKVCIVDDNKVNIDLIKAQLKPFNFNIITALDGEEALSKITSELPDLVILDLMMPRVSGYEVCKAIKENQATQFIPIIVVTALQELDDKLKAIELGADDFLVKPFNKLELTTRIRSLLKIKAMHDDLDTSESILVSLAHALEAKDKYTHGHSDRVSALAMELARELNLSLKQIEIVRRGGLLHDIGKIGIREEILYKPGKLSIEEFEIIKSHPSLGYEICKPLKSLKDLLPCIRSHHERIDGKGYPDGLKAGEIPIEGMVIGVADAFDAMTTDRPYRTGMPIESALAIFEKEIHSGQWNPEIVTVFIQMIRKKNGT